MLNKHSVVLDFKCAVSKKKKKQSEGFNTLSTHQWGISWEASDPATLAVIPISLRVGCLRVLM